MSYPGSQFDELSAGFLAPADYVNPQPKDRYHLVVVGAGPAGLISAIGAAGLGAKVALIERHRMGGDCLNVGCVPSKALLEYTHSHGDASFADAFAYLREVRAGIAPHDSVARYSELGVDVFLGEASFNARGEVMLGDVVFNARRAVICTGARAQMPPIPGLQEAEPLTNETVFDLTAAPQSIAILGAGAIGCELATVFARLGVSVHLFELAERVLPLEIEAASDAVADALQQLGVTLHLGTGVQQIVAGEGEYTVVAAQSTTVQRIVVALGRVPNTETLNLAAAGVNVDERGFIITDNKLRTSNKRIYAAGDCTPHPQFTHNADAHARVVVQNALIAPTAGIGKMVVPHCTYTTPEVASVGLTPAAAQAAGIDYDVFDYALAELDRARARTQPAGFAQVLVKKGSDKVIGATVVDVDAGELIAPLCVIMSNGLGLGAFGATQLPYPTRSEFLKRLADAYNRTRVTPLVSRIFDLWLRWFK